MVGSFLLIDRYIDGLKRRSQAYFWFKREKAGLFYDKCDLIVPKLFTPGIVSTYKDITLLTLESKVPFEIIKDYAGQKL